MSRVLLADIGGSTTRFALSEPGGRPERMVVIDNETVSGLEAAIRRYLDETGARPEMAVLAVAGPIDGTKVKLTNRNWRFCLDHIRNRFGFARVHAINDFEAVAHALVGLAAHELRPVGPLVGPRPGPRVALGPGTGLGVAALLPNGERWTAVPSEGGHISFGPAGADERLIFQRLKVPSDLITAETVISGPGLERLYRAANPHRVPLVAKAIVAQAQAGDAAARSATDLFVRLLGRFAGDMALLFKATGGVYIAGGVAHKVGSLFDEALFRAAFENHPPHRELLSAIPTYLIICDEPGLVGCAAIAKQLDAPEELAAAAAQTKPSALNASL
jgi:glucokinase